MATFFSKKIRLDINTLYSSLRMYFVLFWVLLGLHIQVRGISDTLG